MKKQDCNVFLEEVLTAGGTLSAQAAEHVKNCSECAALREMTERLAGIGQELPEVPEVLDRAVLAHAGQMRRRRSFHQLFFRRMLPGAAAVAAAAVCMVALGALSWQGWVSLLIIVALALNTLFMAFGTPQVLRCSVLFTSTLVLLYNVFVFSIGGMLNEGLAIVSSAVGVIRYRKKTADFQK